MVGPCKVLLAIRNEQAAIDTGKGCPNAGIVNIPRELLRLWIFDHCLNVSFHLHLVNALLRTTVMSQLSIWLEATRPKTLSAAVAPVMLGSGLAYADGGFTWLPAVICLAFAVLIQIGTNFANDYLDGIKGTDTEARIGPQRAVASGLVAAAVMKWAAIGVLVLGFCIGLSLIVFGGWWLLAVGIASVVCAWCYTGGPFPLAYNGLGDVFVVLFFGFIAVGCTYFVQVGGVTLDALLVGLGCGLLINNLLVVNNYRDRDEDVLARKRTLIVFLGRPFGLRLYMLSACVAGAVPLWLALNGYSWFTGFAWIAVGRSFSALRRMARAESAEDFGALLKDTGVIVAQYGLFLTIGLVLSV